MIYTLCEEGPFRSPVMVSALAGWVDAAGAGTSAAAHLAEDGEVVGSFDPDVLFDYRSQRPILDIVDGSMKRPVWPEVLITHATLAGQDLLVLTGSEPDLAWKAFSSSVADIAHRLGVDQLVTFGSVPAAVPHTLPPPLLTTASDPSLLGEERHPPQGLLRVPAAAVSIVDQAVAARGIPTVGFFVQVPHYVTGPYPAGVLALLRRLGRHLDVPVSLSDLEEEARTQRTRLDQIVADQPEALEHVRALEGMNADERAVSGEELASEIERYLRDNAPDRKPFEEDPGAGGAS